MKGEIAESSNGRTTVSGTVYLGSSPGSAAMEKNILTYAGYLLVLIISFLVASFLPAGDIIKGFALTPGAVSLFLFLNQLWRDERAQERKIELQNKQQDFILGTASHMAKVAYDKHVLFCEEYVDRLQKGLQEMYRDGASKNCINIGRELVNIRQKHSAWLTKKIESELRPIEAALIEIGAKEHLLDYQGVGDERSKTVERVYSLFGLILGHEKKENDEGSKIAIEEVVEIIREILGINALTELRLEATKIAVNRLKK